MGFNNPSVSWSDLERALSDRRGPGRPTSVPVGADGGDSPAWSSHRAAYEPAAQLERRLGSVPYAELHCHSNFSFLDGASHPEELVEEAVRLGLEALALTDHDGFYGVVRFAEAASAYGLPTIFGTELTLTDATPDRNWPGKERYGPRTGPISPRGSAPIPQPDPPGHHLLVLARDPVGYGRLARAISRSQMAGEKGAPRLTLDELAGHAGPPGHWSVLTGCRKGTVPAALEADGPAAANRELAKLVERFGREHVAVELWDHGDPLDSARNDALADIAIRAGVDLVATNNVHYGHPSRRPLATALAAVRARRSLDEMEGWLPAAAGAHLRSGAEQARRFARYPGVVERAAELGLECAFDLKLVAPNLPPFPCPDGLDEMGYLRRLVAEKAARPNRYGPPEKERVRGAYKQLAHELDLIEQLGFPGYFLIVWDIVRFCQEKRILCQGRGSAANSAVCYALDITNADAVGLGLLFERFLAPERDGPPDIDLDIESDRREEVIQFVYDKHGRDSAAQVANVITYRAKSAIRDMAKALGAAPGQQDAWSKEVDRWGPVATTTEQDDLTIPSAVLELAAQVEHFPRHLGIHSGGMVLCDRPVIEVCPVEWARMEDRSVLQWDKDDCAAAGLVKFDLLGLGMLSALHYAVDFIRDHRGYELDLATLDSTDQEVYDMLCRADSVGVFQVESRAQMATLPRLEPRTFYDLVVEVALIRPGPIQGGSVHPYIKRRKGQEPVTYPHPLLEGCLSKTLGIPLFQEQLMQMAIDIAGFTPGEADQLRQAMGSKRSRERMERLRVRLYEGMAERGVVGETADDIWVKLVAFANYGFPESHSVSFAYLVFASSWIKRYEPAAFCAALLNAQPMGFYSPHSLVQDARRHGVVVRSPDINASADVATLEPGDGEPDNGPGRPPARWGLGGPAVRLGIGSVRGIGEDLAKVISAGRPYADMEDLTRRAGVTEAQLESLATAGAFGCFELERREALWSAGAVAQSRPGRLPGVVTGADAPVLPGMEPREEAIADLWSTGVSPEGHPTRFVREHLDRLGVCTATGLADAPEGKVMVAGVVTHRQRPATAGGTLFVNLEDETGLINVVVSKGCWARHRKVARSAPAMLVKGRLERAEGVINVVAERMEALPLDAKTTSRDFR
ncbi:MAG: error-prone DNA polymerase [Acidimicrobiia bacterium]|nr:error-prone DNA polymerase [Acidimicrobiia bacterium]